MYHSVHIYGADVQLHFHNGDEDKDAIDQLIEHMEGIEFDLEKDDVILFKLEGADYESIFNYRDYFNELRENEND